MKVARPIPRIGSSQLKVTEKPINPPQSYLQIVYVVLQRKEISYDIANQGAFTPKNEATIPFHV